MLISSVGRWLLACCLLRSWLNSSHNVLTGLLQGGGRRALSATNVRFDAESLKLVGATIAFILALEAFAYRLGDGLSGCVIVGLLAWLRRVEVRKWPGNTVVRLGKYAPSAAALGAYLIAYYWTGAAGAPAAYREACGWEAGFGVMAGINVLGGITKLWDAGADWFDSRNLGLLVAERCYEGPRILRALRRAVSARPFLCRFLAVSALAAEFGGGLLIFPAARWLCIAVIMLMLIGFALLLGFIEYEWFFVTLALALCSRV